MGAAYLNRRYSFFFRVDVSTDLGGKSAILGAWEENRRKSEESEEIWEESQETEGKRGGTNGKGQREAVEEERAAGAEKKCILKAKFI